MLYNVAHESLQTGNHGLIAKRGQVLQHHLTDFETVLGPCSRDWDDGADTWLYVQELLVCLPQGAAVRQVLQIRQYDKSALCMKQKHRSGAQQWTSKPASYSMNTSCNQAVQLTFKDGKMAGHGRLV